MPNAEMTEARVTQYEFAITIDATPQRVWKAITGQVSSWWLPDFQMLGPESLVTLEPRAGGRLYEQNGDRELLWYSVLSIHPHESLNLVGHCTPDFGGPLTTMMTIRLSPDGDATTVTVTDALYGQLTEGTADSLQSGWKQLFGDGLKTFVESAGD